MGLIGLLLSTNGVFCSAIVKKKEITTDDLVVFSGIEDDIKNLKGDMNKVFFDTRKATNAAHVKLAL